MKDIIKSQYKASLAMLRDAIEKCTEPLWADERYKPPFWRIAYHGLFFTDLYLSENVEEFSPWAKHIDEYESLGPMIHKGGKLPKEGPPYAKDELQEYYDLIIEKLDAAVDSLELDQTSGFPWLPFGKLELQFYNIRHIHHHAGQLSLILRTELGQELGWIAMGKGSG